MIDPYKSKASARLKKAKGQIEGIIKMLDENKYCMDIATQILALEGSLKGVTTLILESHLNTCGAKKLTSRSAHEKDDFIKEILKIAEYSNR